MTGWGDDALSAFRESAGAAVREASQRLGDASVEMLCRRATESFPSAAFVAFDDMEYDNGVFLTVHDVLAADGGRAGPLDVDEYEQMLEDFRLDDDVESLLADLSGTFGTDLRETAGIDIANRQIIDHAALTSFDVYDHSLTQ